MRGDGLVPAVRNSRNAPTHALCFLMSSQVGPSSFRGSRANPSIHNVIRRPGRNLTGNCCFHDRLVASGGARRDRTDDLMLAKHALSQLSYGPLAGKTREMVGPERFELSTSRLSSARSNQLSYGPGSRRPHGHRRGSSDPRWQGTRPRRKRNEDGGSRSG